MEIQTDQPISLLPGQKNPSDCKFEISQAETTFKLRRLTPNGSFKINLKPFFDEKVKTDSKGPATRSRGKSKNDAKRTLQEVYQQEEVKPVVPAQTGVNEKFIDETKNNTVTVRKSLRFIEKNARKNKPATQEEVLPEVTVPEKEESNKLPEMIAETTLNTNISVPVKTNSEKKKIVTPRINVELPDYIKQVNKELNSKKTKGNRAKFYASYNQDDDDEKKNPRKTLPTFALGSGDGDDEKPRKDFIYDLEIVSNKNKREKIKVSFHPGKVDVFSEIPNPIDKEARNSFFRQFNFTTEYRSGYAPIDIQTLQEKEFSYKNHFIKKKQSCANGSLKRVCGVSYVKTLESQQLNVDHIFQKLIPLVFQGSSACTMLPEYSDFMKQVVNNIFEGPNCYLIATVLDGEDERVIREYLHCPEKRSTLCQGKIYIINSLESLWHLFKDKNFICIHLVYDQVNFMKRVKLDQLIAKDIHAALSKSNVQIGIQCKKSLCGKKAFLKTFTEGLQLDDEIDEMDSGDEAQLLEETKEMERKQAEKEAKKKAKQEKRELKEKLKQEKKEKREQELKEKKERKEKEKEEKLHNKPSTEKKKMSLKKKHLHFFDKVKTKLEKNEVFQQGMMKDLFSNNMEEIMKPYLNMLFNKNITPSKDPNELVKAAGFPELMKTPKFLDEPSHAMEVINHYNPLEEPEKEPKETIEIETKKEEESHCDDADAINIENAPVEDPSKIMEIIPEEKEQVKPADQDDKEVIKMEEETRHTTNDASTVIYSENAPKEPTCCWSKFVREVKKDGNINLLTSSLRLELYTHESTWKSADEHTKNLLYTFILAITDLMTEKLRHWTLKRADILKSDSVEAFSNSNKDIHVYEFNPASCENVPFDNSPNLNWHFDKNIKTVENEELDNLKPIGGLRNSKLQGLMELQEIKNPQKEAVSFSLPLYLINTRDSFAFDLIEKVTEVNFNGRKAIKTDYYFDPHTHPLNFKAFVDKFPDYHVGVTTYNNFYSHEELCEIENRCYQTERDFFNNHFFPMTGQMTCTSEKVRRTKFFFGARYMWTRQQLSEPHSMVGAGIRVDVSDRPRWMKTHVENPMVEAGIMEKDFVNSIAMNVYHDGREGIAQHFDDAVRFKQPIYSLRIFSDSRLSFGSQLYGFCNGAFCIPMPRGCITILHEGSYAANGIKHCVRPCDMTGKSAAIILRQMHHKVFNEAKLYDEFVDFPSWFSTLSIQDNAVSYSDQKKIEAEELLKSKKKPEETQEKPTTEVPQTKETITVEAPPQAQTEANNTV